MKYLLVLWMFVSLFACGSQSKGFSGTEKAVSKRSVEVPAFDSDSAYVFVERQVACGPRVPGTKTHEACLNYLRDELIRFGASTIVQEGVMTGYDGQLVPVKNIIGSYNDAARRRILLCAHWDTRPWADSDPDPANYQKPIDGADDGASGVGVLLEVARQLSIKQPEVGVDIIFFDAEDLGTPEFYKGEQKDNTWCLGAQFWAKHPHSPTYRAAYGILLDMVGASDARFYREGVSQYFAASQLDKVWKAATALGYGNYFLNEKAAGITDDHLYINRIAQIPCIDIVNYSPSGTNGFPVYWHTLNDNMSNITRTTLEAVGKTLLYVVYND